MILNRIAKSDVLQNFWLEQTEDNSQSDLVQAKPSKRQYHNISVHKSEKSNQDISMLQVAETEIINMCHSRHFCKLYGRSVGAQHKICMFNLVLTTQNTSSKSE